MGFMRMASWSGILFTGAFSIAHAGEIVPASPVGEAPRSGLVRNGRWSSGIKQFFGTALSGKSSRVWFTGAQGILTEIYWPTIDRPQTRDSQLLVSDGKTFFWEERKNAVSQVKWLKSGVPAYEVLTKDPANRFSIQKTVFTAPDRDAVLMKVRIVRNIPGLKFYFLHNPSVSLTPRGDTAYVNNSDRPGLYASQGQEAQAVLFSVPLRQVSAGFEGENDGFQDLFRDYTMDSHFEYANDGDVVATAQLDLPEEAGVSEFTVAIGFGAGIESAAEQAKGALKGVDASLTKYMAAWSRYQNGLRDLSAQSLDGGQLYRASTALLKASEDKTYPGAFVASPSIPWGLTREDGNALSFLKGSPLVAKAAGTNPRDDLTSGYHMVWPRDLYQIATSLLAAGDVDSARASLSYLRKIQYGPDDGEWDDYAPRRFRRDGAFPQNVWVDGTPYWKGLQMDQVAYPLLLAYRLWQGKHIALADYSSMITRAARFIRDNGPWTGQDRWEENHGASPHTIATQIAALWASTEMFRAMGLESEAKSLRATADAWSSKPGDNLEAWTFTETGALGAGKYYERIEGAVAPNQKWDPNDNASFEIRNKGGSRREKDVIDGGFLELVRLGVRSPRDYHILTSLHVYDATIRVDTKQGPAFFRYLGDGYNKVEETGEDTKGMLWPIFTGERGHYELSLAIAEGRDPSNAVVPYISTMEAFATPSYMIPEQVWDQGEFQGLPTGSATPLAWSHAEYIKLLVSRAEGRVFDEVPAVTQRAEYLIRTPWREVVRERP